MSSFLSHPPSPPQDQPSLPSTSSRASKHTHEADQRLDGEPPRTGHRKGKTAGLRKTRTESSLPTPPRTRDTRHTSQSPAHAHALTSSPPCIPEDHPSRSSSSRLASFAALSSFRRPTFASQLGIPTEEGGLIPPPQIHPAAAPSNPFLSSLAGPSTSSSSGPAPAKRPRHASLKRQSQTILELPSDEQAEADIIRASPIPFFSRDIDPSDPDLFTFSPPPAPSLSRSHEKPRGRLLDFLGPTRHLARYPTSPASSAPPLSSHTLATTTPPATVRKARRVFPPPLSPGAQARLDKLSNPFLSGLGLAKAGKIAPPRVGKLEEKETIGYVFRGAKTLFANPFYNAAEKGKGASVLAGKGSDSEDGEEGDEEEEKEEEEEDRSKLPVDHPDYSPAENPPPRLLFPIATGPSSSSSYTSRFDDSSSDEAAADSDDDEEEHEPGSGVRPRLLFPAATGAADDDDSDDDDKVTVERKEDVGGLLLPAMAIMPAMEALTPRRGVKRTSPEVEEQEESTVFGTPSATPRRSGKKMRF